jgi:chromosome segregation protein
VYLSELNIIGFKSFARKVQLSFNKGITGVVGPNGCGKSNIVDAIRWVMGEQRSGVLRSERMENVIFNGSESAKPVGMAEVSLTIQNNKSILPIEYTEVVITRRLFRSGESQYLINGNLCRLKDILDLFMDTGVGPGTYSVIELQQVEKILNGKADERRAIFEEAAGITKYKLRRKATFRKLEATEKDLIRIEDIMSEVEKNVRSLRRQVSKAERYQTMTRELRDLEIQVSTYEYSKILNELDPLQTKFEHVRDDREASSSTLANFEAKYEETRSQLLGLEKKLSAEQMEFNALEKEIQKLDERILVNKERLRSLEENKNRYLLEQKSFNRRSAELKESLEEITTRMSGLEGVFDEKKLNYQELDAKYQTVREKYNLLREQVRRHEEDLLRITEEISRLLNRGERLKANEENLSSRLAQLDQEDNEAEEKNRDLINRLTQVRSDEEKYNQTLNEKRKQLESKEKQTEESLRSYEGLQKIDNQDENKIEVLNNQAALIRRLIENFEDYPAGVRHLLTAKSEELKNFGPFANILHIDESYRPAISAALGDAATFLLVDNADRALTGIEMLRQDKKGVVTFLPIQQLRFDSISHPQLDDLGVIGWADELVDYKPEFEQAVKALLGRFLVVQDQATATRILDDAKQYGINLVTLGGEVLTFWGLIRGGAKSKQQAELIGRQEQLASLLAQIEEIKKRREQRLLVMSELEEKAHADKIDAEELHTQLKSLEEELGAKRIELGRLTFEEQTLNEAKAKRASERQRLLEQMGQVDRNLKEQNYGTEDQQARRQQFAKQAQEKNDTLKSLEKELNTMAEKVKTASVELAREQSDFDALKREQDSVKRQISETESLIQTRESESKSAEREARELEEVNAEYADRIESLKKKTEIIRERIETLEVEQYEANTKIADQERQIRQARTKAEELSESIHHHELRVSELKMRAQNLLSRMKEEYDYSLERKEIDDQLPIDDMSEKMNQLKERIKDFGPVNLLALKEYEQEKNRMEFLQNQKDDLISAKKNLVHTIDTINQTARKQFLETFESVQQNFSKVFKSFFEGGRASLILREGVDPLEADIDIYATPGGKRLSALTLLSGGEKSLTAISLLFAIYLVKPSPFCIFDEVDAPLDDRNVRRYTTALEDYAQETQFILVTHNKLTMRAAQQLYGVTMQEEGVSKVVSVQFEKEEEKLVPSQAEQQEN